MNIVDNLLAVSFDSIQEPEKKQSRDNKLAQKELHPDVDGCIYEIQAPLHNSFDFCSSFIEAQKIAKAYHEYKIWKIFVGSQKRICLEEYEQRQHNNALRVAIQQKGIA